MKGLLQLWEGDYSIAVRNNSTWPIAAAARSTEWVCGRSLAGTAGSNPAEGMDICLL